MFTIAAASLIRGVDESVPPAVVSINHLSESPPMARSLSKFLAQEVCALIAQAGYSGIYSLATYFTFSAGHC